MTAARVIQLDAYRRREPVPALDVRAVGGGSTCRPGLAYRLTHSPAARDLRAHPLAAGLLLSVVLVLIWSLT